MDKIIEGKMGKIEISFTAGVEYQGRIYVSPLDINGLMEFDLTTQKLSYIKRFVKEEGYLGLHQRAFLYKNKAWFIPKLGQYIAIVDLDILEIDYIEPPYKIIKERTNTGIKALYYSGGLIAKRFLYLVPTNTDTFLVIDLETKTLYPYYDISIENEIFLNAAYQNEEIYLFPFIGNKMMKLNLYTKEKRIYSLEWFFKMKRKSRQAYINMIYCKGRVWMIPCHADNILSVDLSTQEVEIIPLGNYYDERYTYHDAFLEGDILYVLPLDGEKILKLNIINKKISELYLEEKFLDNNKNRLFRLDSKDKKIFCSTRKSYLFIYDLEKDSYDSIKMDIERNVFLKWLNEETGKKGLLRLKELIDKDCYIEKILGLECFMEAVEKKEDLEENRKSDRKNIWDIVKSTKK